MTAVFAPPTAQPPAPAPATTAPRRREASRSVALRWVLLAIGLVAALLPFLWMLRTAIGPAQDAISQTAAPIPASLDLTHFRDAWRALDLGTALVNGVIVSGSILLLQLATGIPAAYAFACMRFKGRSALFGLVLATLLVPTQVVSIPNYVTISGFGVNDSRIGLILPFVTSAFTIFLLRQYMTTIPPAVLEAAKMDGLGTWRTLWRVVVPLSAPAVATVATFSFLVSFNDYLWPLLVARSPSIATPTLALAQYSTKSTIPDYALLSAAALIISIPTLVVFLVAQRRLSAGLAGTGADPTT